MTAGFLKAVPRTTEAQRRREESIRASTDSKPGGKRNAKAARDCRPGRGPLGPLVQPPGPARGRRGRTSHRRVRVAGPGSSTLMRQARRRARPGARGCDGPGTRARRPLPEWWNGRAGGQPGFRVSSQGAKAPPVGPSREKDSLSKWRGKRECEQDEGSPLPICRAGATACDACPELRSANQGRTRVGQRPAGQPHDPRFRRARIHKRRFPFMRTILGGRTPSWDRHSPAGRPCHRDQKAWHGCWPTAEGGPEGPGSPWGRVPQAQRTGEPRHGDHHPGGDQAATGRPPRGMTPPSQGQDIACRAAP